MNDFNLRGSLCLSDIPKELIKKGNNGKLYLNINVWAKREPFVFKGSDGSVRTYTHTIQCACPKEKQRTDVPKGYYYIGDLETRESQPSAPSYENVENAPAASSGNVENLPF